MFQVSRTTVRQAISELVQEGHLYRVKSKGTFVAEPKIVQNFLNKLQSFNDEVRDSGHVPSTEVLHLELVDFPERYKLDYPDFREEKCVSLERRRFIDGEPVATVHSYLPASKCGFLLTKDLEKNSLYGLLGVKPETKVCRVRRTCEAVAARKHDSENLGIKVGAPTHRFVSQGYNKFGELVELSFARYRGDRNKFTIELVSGED